MGGKFMKRVGLVAAASLLVGGAAACYPGSISDIGEADLVLTAYDTATDFGALQTYFLIDSVIRVGDGDEEIDTTYDAGILAKVASEMERLGYTAVDTTGGVAPDVFVAVGTNSSTFGWWVPGGCWYCYYPGYPGWGPGWGYPGYPGYPWYPGGGYGGTYQTGSVALVIGDPEVTEGQTEPIAYWGAVINGLLSSSTANTAARVDRLIEQAFDQSPYLATN